MEADCISGLDLFPSFNLFVKILKTNLGILNNTSDLEFFHSVSDLNELGFWVPDKTIYFDLLDFFEKFLEVGFLLINLDVENDNGFSSRLFLLGLSSDDGLGSLRLGVIIISEKIIIIFSLLVFLLFFLLSLSLISTLFGLESFMGFLGKFSRSNLSNLPNNTIVPVKSMLIFLSLSLAEKELENNWNAAGKGNVGDCQGLSNKEFLSIEVFLNKIKEFVKIGDEFSVVNFLTIDLFRNGSSWGLEITGCDVQPLINQGLVVSIGSEVKFGLVCGGQESGDGVWSEECSFSGLEQGQGIDCWQVWNVVSWVVGNFFHLRSSCCDHGSQFSSCGETCGVGVEVKFHVVEDIIISLGIFLISSRL